MTDSRPRPEYGEYATPEEQARAMGREPVAATPAPQPPAAPVPPPATATAVRAGSGNRFFTIFFLLIGLLELILGAPGFYNLPEFLKLGEKATGNSVPVPASLDGLGIWVIVLNVVIYLLTALWAISALRRGRYSAYIPIIGCLVFFIAWAVLINSIAPDFAAQLNS